MKKILLTLLTLLPLLISAQEASIIGTWQGTLSFSPAQRLALVLHIVAEGDSLTATLDSPDQGAYGIAIDEVLFEEAKTGEEEKGSLAFVADALRIKYHGTLHQDSILGTFTQNGFSIPLNLKRQKAKKEQDNLPYISEDLDFINPHSGLKISGTLTRPHINAASPAMLLIAGSGPMNRDERALGHTPFSDIADYLTRAGFIVYRYDKRGINKSEGNFHTATLGDFISDATEALKQLRQNPHTDSQQITILGHSEGGLIAQVIASKYPELLQKVILLASPARPTTEVLAYQNNLALTPYFAKEENGATFTQMAQETFAQIALPTQTRAEDSLLLLQVNEQVLSLVRPEAIPLLSRQITDPIRFQQALDSFQSKYFKEFLSFDPAQYLPHIPHPILALNGDKDRQVEAEPNIQAITELTHHRATTKIYPELNHLFVPANTGLPTEYATLPKGFSKEVLQDILQWLLAH